jgi:hypothetical protein
MVARCERAPGPALILIGDENFRAKDFGRTSPRCKPRSWGPAARMSKAAARNSRRSAQRIESTPKTSKDVLLLERQCARTLAPASSEASGSASAPGSPRSQPA